MAEKFNQYKYQNEFNKKTYDRMELILPKGKKAEITEIAKKLGYKSRNEFVISAIKEKIERESGKAG